MPYRIAGIDVHKRMLAVVVSDVEIDGEYVFERRQFGGNPAQLRLLADWLLEQQVEEVVMESTAQYWRPVWGTLERYWKPVCQKRDGARPTSGTLHLAQAQSNRARRGRKKDFADAERLVKRLVANELTLSFVPDPQQRLWRTVARAKYQQRRNRVQLQGRLEALLEEAHIKLSSLVSDLLGASARRMLKARPTRGLWPPWLIIACAPRPNSCAMRWVHARSSILSTADCSRRCSRSWSLSRSRLASSIRRWPICSVRTKTKSSDWPRCPVWEWTRRSCRLGPSARESS